MMTSRDEMNEIVIAWMLDNDVINISVEDMIDFGQYLREVTLREAYQYDSDDLGDMS